MMLSSFAFSLILMFSAYDFVMSPGISSCHLRGRVGLTIQTAGCLEACLGATVMLPTDMQSDRCKNSYLLFVEGCSGSLY